MGSNPFRDSRCTWETPLGRPSLLVIRAGWQEMVERAKRRAATAEVVR